MEFPTYENPTAYPAQAVVDSVDLQALAGGVSLNGVVSGGAVGQRFPSAMGVSIAAGNYIFNGGLYTVSTTTLVSIGAASAGDRRDAIWVDETSGSITFGCTPGTPSDNSFWQFTTATAPPIKTTIPSGAVLLAEVYVVGTTYSTPTTTITTAEILDKRITIIPPSTVTYATEIDNSNSSFIYVGEAGVGASLSAAVWRIAKVTTGSMPTITYANGASTFVNVWNNRSSYTYS